MNHKMAELRAAIAAKSGPCTAPQSSMSNMSFVAQRHMLRFVSAYTLAVVECVTPQMGRVARAAVVELMDSRFRIKVEPVAGCAWRMLVQEGLAGVGCAGLALGGRMECSSTLTAVRGVGVVGIVVSWGMGRRPMSRCRS